MNYFIVMYSDTGLECIVDLSEEMETDAKFIFEKLKDPDLKSFGNVDIESMKLGARLNSHRNVRIYAFGADTNLEIIEELFRNDSAGIRQLVMKNGLCIY